MNSRGTATYYDRLGRWNRVAHAFGYGGGDSALTVHRVLADPAAGGRATYTRIHDIIFEQLHGIRATRVLDAGCGLGGMLIAAADRFGSTGVGLTLSPTQAARANRAAAKRGVGHLTQALVRSYDTPPPGPFDLIVAIESLAHSPDPARSIGALASVLAPGGAFVIVDDMPEPAAERSDDLATFKRGWGCPVLATAPMHVSALTDAGLTVSIDRDLTPDCRVRTLGAIRRLAVLNRMMWRVVPSAALRQVLDAHMGGLALERLLRTGLVKYRLLVAWRPGVQVS